jgi:O-antigen/teichoic acid export membrane protein
MAQTAGYNIALNAAGALAGVIIARVTGPSVRGEYAAVTAWLGIVTMVGEVGQPVAICYYVAHDPGRARGYVATSRTMMLVTGVIAMVAGLLVAPLLARHQPSLTMAYRIAFLGLLCWSVSDSYLCALMGRDLGRWNRIRVIQPIVALAGVIVASVLGYLSLDSALVILVGTLAIQLGWAYWGCRRSGLAPGRVQTELIRPLAGYGSAQIAAMAPASLNAYLDQLILSVTVPAADLGRYSIAVSMALLPAPLVSAIGYVLFPKLAAQANLTAESHKLQRQAIVGSAALAAAILLPLAAAAPWLVPLVFGPAYRGAVPLLWILTPGGIFLACGQVVANVLRGCKQQIVVAWAEGLAAVFTVVLLIVLLPMLGVTGAAIASTVPYGISLAVMTRSLRRLSPSESQPDPDPATPEGDT